MIPKECMIDRCDEGVRDLLNSNNEYHLPYLDTYTGPWGDSPRRRMGRQHPLTPSALLCADLFFRRSISASARVSENKTRPALVPNTCE
jgi:hypothetical protein